MKTHDEIQERFPEYMAGQLADHVFQQVENHIRHCPECQESLKESREIRRRLRLMWSLIIRPSRWRWVRIYESIMASHGKREQSIHLKPSPITPQPRVKTWQLVLVGGLIGVILGGSIVYFIEWARTPTFYRTLNQSPPRTNASPVMMLWIQFHPRASVADINALMQSIHARIIDGPDTQSRFITAVPIRKPANRKTIVHYLQSRSDIILTARPFSNTQP